MSRPKNPHDQFDWHAYAQGVKPLKSPKKADIQKVQKVWELQNVPKKHLPITSTGSLAYSKPKRHSKPAHIDRTLDMHGMTKDLAFAALERFLERAWKEGDITLRIITGKGTFTPAMEDKPRGVLRDSLPQWLEQTHLRAYISYYTFAKPEDGGSGAFYVVLKKQIKNRAP